MALSGAVLLIRSQNARSVALQRQIIEQSVVQQLDRGMITGHDDASERIYYHRFDPQAGVTTGQVVAHYTTTTQVFCVASPASSDVRRAYFPVTSETSTLFAHQALQDLSSLRTLPSHQFAFFLFADPEMVRQIILLDCL